ncbi:MULTISPECIES: phosphonate ABC transporter, permease protein PhnE [Vibrio]|uniref:Phosphonate ABC transporter permease protein n=1 Tax=Vibrio halioticoli NBRC 102217 TaxID=1219072 RepID=V5FIN0_9VIBR|nr:MULTISPECIES: phosphonate ABC transporter, permease protein PhnE [Vibrio]MPW35599.1 phosphonate ABC transporter, permease protein PhnE [Vibrio sp. B1Z05]GAD88837.1 phosphonate ABC transporter permease protein [Vibrio halioticoli NBRC 102217]
MTQFNSSLTVWRKYDEKQTLLRWSVWLAFITLLVYAWQLMNQDTIWYFVTDAPNQIADIGSRMWPPRWSYLEHLWLPLWDTLNIATLGTLLGIVMAFPVAFLAAQNTTPSAVFIRPIALFIIAASRSINSLIWALLLVAILGPGLLAGIIAIALRSIGFISKLMYEAIEEVNVTQVSAIRATGASPLQVLDYGVLPQVMPSFIGTSLFRWDINIRESTVLGLVGAGGIGLKLQESMAVLAWPQVTVIFCSILVTVVISEWISAKARHALI